MTKNTQSPPTFALGKGPFPMSASYTTLSKPEDAPRKGVCAASVGLLLFFVAVVAALVGVAVFLTVRPTTISPLYVQNGGVVFFCVSHAACSLESRSVREAVEEKTWDRNAFVRALSLFKAGKPSRFRFSVNGEEYLVNTLRVRDNGDNSISWTGDFMSSTHDQHFATLTFTENEMSGSITCSKCTHVVEPIGDRRIRITKRPNELRLPTPPIEMTDDERELAKLDVEIDSVPEKQVAEGIKRSLGSNGQSVAGIFKRLRILLVFNTASCTAAERNKAANVDNMLTLVFSNNMGMTNWELVYTCKEFSTGSPNRNEFAERVRKLGDNVRKQYGGDLIIGIGQFSFELHWRAGGTAGPTPTAISFATPEAADELLVMPHELLHNFGNGHDRYNAFSNQGTYFCETTSTSCNFGFQSAEYMTIQSYGTAMGGCAIPGPNPRRIYVLSGYPIPGTNTVLGVPCGTGGVAGGAWNRAQFESAWNTIADYYSSSDCPFVSCPNPPPPQGCICSRTPFAGAPDATVTSASPTVQQPTFAAPTVALTTTTRATFGFPTSVVAPPTSAPRVTLCASSAGINKRVSPSGTVIGSTAAGESFVRLAVSGSWTQLRGCRSSSTFWISSSLLRTCFAQCQ